MSAPVDQSQFKTSVEQSFFVVATLWRGAMVERFARIEFFVDRSIAACAKAGIDPAKNCSDHLPTRRIEVLLKSLEDPRLAEHSITARKSLAEIKDCWVQRNALCHGRMHVLKRSVRIDWRAYTKGISTPRAVPLNDCEMLAFLEKMDRAQAALGSQLGYVDKVCAGMAAAHPL